MRLLILILLALFTYAPNMAHADGTEKAMGAIKSLANESKNLTTTSLGKKAKLQLSKKIDTVLNEYIGKIKQIRSFEAPGTIRSRHLKEVVEDYYKKLKVLIRTQKGIDEKELKVIFEKLKAQKKIIMESLNATLKKETSSIEIPTATPIIDKSPFDNDDSLEDKDGTSVWDR